MMQSKPLAVSSECIFYDAPAIMKIDEEAKTRYSTAVKIDTLIEELKEKGPLVALGYMGPECYNAPPFKLKEKFEGKEIYGWQPGTRSETEKKTYAFVIGARKIDAKEYVYFKLSNDHTVDRNNFIREHQITQDDRIFVSSHKTFSNHLVDLYPRVSEKKLHPNFISSFSTDCSAAEMEYVLKLVSIPLDSILDGKEGEEACKTLGQEIFNTFKKEKNGSLAGQAAAVRICDAMRKCAKDGPLRGRYIECAWDGIGDEQWRWHH